jgi:hypothetical protein
MSVNISGKSSLRVGLEVNVNGCVAPAVQDGGGAAGQVDPSRARGPFPKRSHKGQELGSVS